MTIAASGPIRIDHLRNEYATGAVPKLATARLWRDFRRGTTRVRVNAGDNSAVNNSASVPTTGPIRLSVFRGQGAGWTFTNSAVVVTTGDHNWIHIPFGNDWNGNDWPKTYVNANALVSTSVNYYACVIYSGVGTITFVNNWEVQGAGGSPNSNPGQIALLITATSAKPIVINNGAIRGGGGAGGIGGTGGTGGQGYYGYTASEGPAYSAGTGGYNVSTTFDGDHPANANSRWYWAGSNVANFNGSGTSGIASAVVGSITYFRGTRRTNDTTNPPWVYNTYEISRQYPATAYTSGGGGGGGGNGGRGIGYNSANLVGSVGAGGAGGGTNAGQGGAGGTGGTGGSWGQDGGVGGTGGPGITGNYTGGAGGAAGAAGGAAGPAIYSDSAWSYQGSGTLNGTYSVPVTPT